MGSATSKNFAPQSKAHRRIKAVGAIRHSCEWLGAAIEETIDLDCRLRANALFEQGLEPTSEHSSCETPLSSPIRTWQATLQAINRCSYRASDR